MKNKCTKIFFVSSSGGHFSELYKLKSVAKHFESFLLTEKTKSFFTDFTEHIYLTKELNRKDFLFLFRLIKIFFLASWLIFKNRPSFLITTGALISFPCCIAAKILRVKVIYIESFARINSLSLTGKLIYPIANLFFVQREDLRIKYKKALFYGSLMGEIK